MLYLHLQGTVINISRKPVCQSPSTALFSKTWHVSD